MNGYFKGLALRLAIVAFCVLVPSAKAQTPTWSSVGSLSWGTPVSGWSSSPSWTVVASLNWASLGGPQGNSHNVILTWTSAVPTDPPIASYNAYRSSSSGAEVAPAIGTASATSTTFEDDSVKAGDVWYYVVTAVDAIGDESVFSSETSATVPSP